VVIIRSTQFLPSFLSFFLPSFLSFQFPVCLSVPVFLSFFFFLSLPPSPAFIYSPHAAQRLGGWVGHRPLCRSQLERLSLRSWPPSCRWGLGEIVGSKLVVGVVVGVLVCIGEVPILDRGPHRQSLGYRNLDQAKD
jgi:hypothetical protein